MYGLESVWVGGCGWRVGQDMAHTLQVADQEAAQRLLESEVGDCLGGLEYGVGWVAIARSWQLDFGLRQMTRMRSSEYRKWRLGGCAALSDEPSG